MRLFTFLCKTSSRNITILSHLLQLNTYKTNIETNLLEEYVKFVDNTKKENIYFKILIVFFCGYFMFVFLFCFI